MTYSVVWCILIGSVTSLPLAVADTPPLDLLNEVLASPDFGHRERAGWDLRLKPRPHDDKPLPRWSDPWWLTALHRSSASVLRAVLIGAGIGGAGLLLWYAKKRRPPRLPVIRPRLTASPPQEQENAALILTCARAYAAAGQSREALAAALTVSRLALASWSDGVAGTPGTTEYEYLAAVARTPGTGAVVPGLSRLIGDWVTVAYQGRAITTATLTGHLAFCASLLEPSQPAASP